MKMLLGFVLIAAIGAAGGLFVLAQQSKNGAAPGLANGLANGGALSPCPSSPNCVSSEAGTPESHAIPALPLSAWAALPGVIKAEGGDIVVTGDAYIAATFRTSLFGFVDDVEFRLAEDAVHVRSASRVGHSDMGANAKRVEALRAALGGSSAP